LKASKNGTPRTGSVAKESTRFGVLTPSRLLPQVNSRHLQLVSLNPGLPAPNRRIAESPAWQYTLFQLCSALCKLRIPVSRHPYLLSARFGLLSHLRYNPIRFSTPLPWFSIPCNLFPLLTYPYFPPLLTITTRCAALMKRVFPFTDPFNEVYCYFNVSAANLTLLL
jgi:hypothetical protein